jgi:hypothetical protein
MASVMFGVIKFFITHFLKYGLRSPQSYLAVGTGRARPTTLDSDGGRRLPDR